MRRGVIVVALLLTAIDAFAQARAPQATLVQRLFFYLRPGKGVLSGAVTMGVRRGSPFEGRVSYWVELGRPR